MVCPMILWPKTSHGFVQTSQNHIGFQISSAELIQALYYANMNHLSLEPDVHMQQVLIPLSVGVEKYNVGFTCLYTNFDVHLLKIDVKCKGSVDFNVYVLFLNTLFVISAAEFGVDGRPFHFLFYTGLSNYYQLMHVSRQHCHCLNSATKYL